MIYLTDRQYRAGKQAAGPFGESWILIPGHGGISSHRCGSGSPPPPRMPAAVDALIVNKTVIVTEAKDRPLSVAREY